MYSLETTLPQMTILGHYIEDAKAIVTYKRVCPEPDVGVYGGVEIQALESRSGRPLKRILKHMPQPAWDLLVEYVGEQDYYEAAF